MVCGLPSDGGQMRMSICHDPKESYAQASKAFGLPKEEKAVVPQ